MQKKSQTEAEPQLPIKLDATTNGEYAPRPLPARTALALRTAELRSAETARALGMTRRAFLESSCEEYKNHPRPSHATYGPRTRRELLGLLHRERALHA